MAAIDRDVKCPLCQASGTVEGVVAGADVELHCPGCGGEGYVTDEDYHAICEDHGLCTGCGEEVCNSGCSEWEHADILFHEDR